jgi:Ca2+-binding RTX toxin-like protein
LSREKTGKGDAMTSAITRLMVGALTGVALFVPSGAQAAPTCSQNLPATHVGTPGNDTIQGTNRSDVIVGLGGNDHIEGRGGEDAICGNGGHDFLYGGDLNDYLEGGDGDDYLEGQGGDDQPGVVLGGLFGGPGDDSAYGGGGRDYIQGQDGDDHLYLGSGLHGELHGGYGADSLYAQSTQSVIEIPLFLLGGPGNDYVVGGPGSDLLRAGLGADDLYGAEGNDDLRANDTDLRTDYLDGAQGTGDTCSSQAEDVEIRCED